MADRFYADCICQQAPAWKVWDRRDGRHIEGRLWTGPTAWLLATRFTAHLNLQAANVEKARNAHVLQQHRAQPPAQHGDEGLHPARPGQAQECRGSENVTRKSKQWD